MSPDPDPRLRRAVIELTAFLRDRLARHPLGHLADPRRALDVAFSVPLGDGRDRYDEAAIEAAARLDAGIDEALAPLAALRPGRAHCLRCDTADCEHATPGGLREVFVGYGPTGMPRFLDFGQWRLETRDPRSEHLFGEVGPLVTEITSGRRLLEDLLPAFRARKGSPRIHGQVTAGWYPLHRRGGRQVVAITLQVVSSRGRRGLRRLELNVLAGAPGESPELLFDGPEATPWQAVVRWTRSVLERIERGQTARGATVASLSDRVEGLLTGVARRLERDRRAHRGRTRHARVRHAAGDRPTEMARADLRRATAESLLIDERGRTVVVLGERGRAHVFTPGGRHVTSIRYSPESIDRKRRHKIWRPATPQEIASFRRQAGGG